MTGSNHTAVSLGRNDDPEDGQSFARIADDIRRRIRSHVLMAGDRLPSQRQLAADYCANRHAVRLAIETLVREGFVTTRHGSGMFVRRLTLDYRIKSRTRWSDIVRGRGEGADIRLIDFEEKRGTPAIWSSLSLQRGERVFEFTLLRVLDGTPICLAHHTVPASRFPGLDEKVRSVRSVSGLFMEYGIEDYKRSDTTMTCRLPEKEEIQLLCMQRGQPLIVLEGRNIDKNGRPLEISRSKWPADCISVKI